METWAMSYNSVLTRGTGPSYSSTPGTHPLIPEDVSREILKAVPEKSAVLEMFKKRTMSTAQQRMPVLASKPLAHFVSGDTGLKQTTAMTWSNKFLDAEEIATIVPIPEKLLDDTDYDIWAEIKPEIVEAIAITLDAAVLFGYNKPTSWPAAIVVAAIAAGNTVNQGAGVDVAADVNSLMATVEADGYEVDGFFMRTSMKAQFRGLRDSQQGLIFQAQPSASVEKTTWTGDVWGVKAVSSRAGLFEEEDAGTYGRAANSIKMIGGNWKQGLIGTRQDLTWKMLDQAVITDADGNIVFNLPQQDMVALRCTSRYAFQVPNPYNRMQTAEANRYPFGVLRDTA
jgi:HK97 family phage major capsid protein